MTAQELSDASGFSFDVPEGAKKIYRYMKSDDLAEMQFTLGSDEFCARIQPVDEPKSISGMFFEWENEEEAHIGDYTGTVRQAQTGSEDWVELCQQYDVERKWQYSLSAYTTDVDGFDLTTVAELIYKN